MNNEVIIRQAQPIQVWLIPCRWCNKLVFPRIIEGEPVYPKACSNPKCKRTTYKSSDREISEMRQYQTSCLKYQGGRKKKKHVEIVPAERLVCFMCDIVHQSPEALQRHNARRHA